MGKNPDIRTFETGAKRASFTMATSEIRKDKDGNRIEQTEWHNIVCWRNLAEIAEKYLQKGKQIYLEGKLRTRSWDDNGVKHYVTEIEASTFTMLGNKDDVNGSTVVTQVTNNAGVTPTVAPVLPVAPVPSEPVDTTTDDLPF